MFNKLANKKKKTLNNQNMFSTPFTFLLAIVLYFIIRYTDSDYLFGIFKLFLISLMLEDKTTCLYLR